MKEGMKHALGMLRPLHNWNCVPWTIYSMYSRVIENCTHTHTHTLACPNPIPLGEEEEEERERIRNGCGV
jgi:hypothetical protein